MTPNRDVISVVETAYQFDGTDGDWLNEIVDALRRSHPDWGRGYGMFIDLSDPVRWRVDIPEIRDAAVPRELLQNMLATSDAQGMLRILSRRVGTTSAQLGKRAWANHPLRRMFYEPHGNADTLGMIAVDSRRIGCLIGLATPVVRTLTPRERVRFERLTIHVACALRLRRTLRDAPGGEGDAVLDPSGRLLHATKQTSSHAIRDALRDRAVSIDRARGRLRRADPEAALGLWQALVEARWSLVDHFDRDGRRFLIARQNSAAPYAPVRLSRRERDVAALAAAGASNKWIAYELGLAVSTVAVVLTAAVEKLGVSTRRELVHAFSNVVQRDGDR